VPWDPAQYLKFAGHRLRPALDLLNRIETGVKPEEIVPPQIIFTPDQWDQLHRQILAVRVAPEILRRLEFFASQFEYCKQAAWQLEYKTKDTAKLSGIDWAHLASLDTGKDADWFQSTQIVILAIVTAIGFAAFLIWELTAKNPIVDLSLFKSRNFALGTLAFCLGYAVFFANNLLMPLWLQTQVGYTATWAGLVAAPAGVVAVLLTPLATKLMAKYDARIVASLAFVAFGVSFLMRARFTNTASFLDFVLPLLVQGIALATYFLAMITILLDGVPPQKIPLASGLSNFARITGGGFAASIVTTFWDRREALHQSRLADHTTIFSPGLADVVKDLHSFGFSTLAGQASVTRTIVNQAYLLAAEDIFWVSGWLCLLMVGMVWLCRRSVSSG